MDLSRVGPGFDDPVLDAQQNFRAILAAMAEPGLIEVLKGPRTVPSQWALATWATALTLLDDTCTVWVAPSLANPAALSSLRFHTGCTLSADPIHADFLFVAAATERPPLENLKQGEAEFPDQSATLILQLGALWTPKPEGPPGDRDSTIDSKLDAGVHPASASHSAPKGDHSGAFEWQLQGPGIEHERLLGGLFVVAETSARAPALAPCADPGTPLPAAVSKAPAAAGRLLEELRHNASRFPRGVDLILSADSQLACLPRTTRVAVRTI